MNLNEMIKAYGGMIVGKTDYWHPNMVVNENISIEKIGAYYIDMRPKHNYIGKSDNNGIPLLECDGEYSYFVVTIAQYALGNFDKFIDTDEIAYFKKCEKCADWFVNNISTIGTNIYGYNNDVDKMIYKMKKPWLSALTQAQVMSVLARCYSINKKEIYKITCENILKSFEIKSEDGGVLAFLNDEYFYEEYPSKIPSYVLNGFIFSLWGLLDYYIVSGNTKAYKFYCNGVTSLQKNLKLYNIKFINWSRYDLYPFKIKDITSIFYHKLHIEQLKAMFLLTKNDEFRNYYMKWQRSRNNKLIYIIATLYKIIHKLSVRKESNYVPSIKEGSK